MTLPEGPREHPLVTTWRWLRKPQELMESNRARFGDVFTMKLPALPPIVMFCNPEAVKEVFADDGETLAAGKFNLSLRAFLGDHSVLMLDGKEHMRHRKLLLPPFQGERMQAYGQAMIDLTNDSIDAWPLREAFAVHGRMQGITMRVIVRTVFGFERGPGFERMCALLTRMLDLASWPPLLIPTFQVDLGRFSPWGRFQRTAAEVTAALLEQIRERRRDGEAATGRNDVLALLIAARDEQGAPLRDEEIMGELVTLLVAGHETTATTLAWAFRLVLGAPEVKTRLTSELSLALAQGALTPERVSKLEYLDAVVRETLRLQPVVPIVGRILERDTTLGGHALAKGTAVACSIFLAQRRASVYPDPTRFDPARFLGKKFTPNEFFPFGGGIRRCIGMAFALYEIKMVLATALCRTQLRLAPGPPPTVARRSITLTPSDGTRVIVDQRSPRAASA